MCTRPLRPLAPRLPARFLAAVLLLLAASCAAAQDAAIDPECIDTDAPCELDGECCSNRCLDSVCAADARDPRLLAIVATCPEASGLIDALDTPLPDELLSKLLASSYFVVQGEHLRPDASVEFLGGSGAAELTADGKVLLLWFLGHGESDTIFVSVTGLDSATGQLSTLWNVRPLDADGELDPALPGDCWIARSQEAGEGSLAGALATWRLPAAPWAPQHLELFAAADDGRRLLYSLEIAPEALPGDAAVDPDCLDSGAACESDAECCEESCFESICQPAPDSG